MSASGFEGFELDDFETIVFTDNDEFIIDIDNKTIRLSRDKFLKLKEMINSVYIPPSEYRAREWPDK